MGKNFLPHAFVLYPEDSEFPRDLDKTICVLNHREPQPAEGWELDIRGEPWSVFDDRVDQLFTKHLLDLGAKIPKTTELPVADITRGRFHSAIAAVLNGALTAGFRFTNESIQAKRYDNSQPYPRKPLDFDLDVQTERVWDTDPQTQKITNLRGSRVAGARVAAHIYPNENVRGYDQVLPFPSFVSQHDKQAFIKLSAAIGTLGASHESPHRDQEWLVLQRIAERKDPQVPGVERVLRHLFKEGRRRMKEVFGDETPFAFFPQS